MIPLPDKKYSIIYADPPWSYQNRGTRAAASKHYDTMTCLLYTSPSPRDA